MSKPRVREDLQSLPAYKAGQKLQPREGLEVFKLSSNENTYEPLPSVIDAISKAASTVNRYPDPFNTEMIAAIANSLKVNPENIAVGTGAVAVLGHVIEAMAGYGDEVIFPWRSFEAYPIAIQLSQVTAVPVPLMADESHDLDAMINAITDKTKMILVCTPNNPTGNSIRTSDLESFMEKVPSNVLVVIDEAYCDFVTDESKVRGMEFFNKFDNVALLRTFSKSHGLAGLRVGFAVAQPEIADYIRRTALPFGINNLAQVAVVASLTDEATRELEQRVSAIASERDRIVEQLRTAGWKIGDSDANFFWLRTTNPDALKTACEDIGIAVRPFPEGVRITVGEPAANERVLKMLMSYPQK